MAGIFSGGKDRRSPLTGGVPVLNPAQPGVMGPASDVGGRFRPTTGQDPYAKQKADEAAALANAQQRDRQQTEMQGPNIQSPFTPAPPGIDAPKVTQPAYEQQALFALQQQGQRDLSGQQIAAEKDMQASGFANQASLAAQQAAAERALQEGSFAGQGGLLRQQGEQDLGMLNRRAELGEGAWRDRFNTVMGSFGGGSGAGLPRVLVGGGINGNEAAARAAAFARAKEQAGNTAAAALASLRGLFEGRGTMGSTMEAAQAGQIIGGAGAGVNEFTRDQLISDLAREAELADMEFQGGITQRGQDLSARNALLALINNGPIY